VQRSGFATEDDVLDALKWALEAVRREQGVTSSLTLADFVDEYLAQHDQSVDCGKRRRQHRALHVGFREPTGLQFGAGDVNDRANDGDQPLS